MVIFFKDCLRFVEKIEKLFFVNSVAFGERRKPVSSPLLFEWLSVEVKYYLWRIWEVFILDI